MENKVNNSARKEKCDLQYKKSDRQASTREEKRVRCERCAEQNEQHMQTPSSEQKHEQMPQDSLQLAEFNYIDINLG